MNIVSLCSGYGGLDLAVKQVFGGTTVAFAEIEDAPAAVFARHWPDARPLGDLTAVDWTTVEADIVCAGFPCQDLSYAGKGAGIVKDSRSGLWYAIEHALGVLRPRIFVAENVGAIVARRPGLDVVLSGLAGLGFDAEWTCVRASDVGAPHRRERWFLVAYAQRFGCVDGEPEVDAGAAALQEVGDVASGGGATTTDAERLSGAGRGEAGHLAGPPRGGESQGGQRQRDGDAADDRRAATSDTDGGRCGERSEPHGGTQQPGLKASRRGDAGRRDTATADAARIAEREQADQAQPLAGSRNARHVPGGGGGIAWGDYGPAVARWAAVLGRPAPRPTDDRGRLSPRFVEWMMGLPDGWVTDTPGLSRAKQLKALGNGVVPQQAMYALTSLTEVREVAA